MAVLLSAGLGAWGYRLVARAQTAAAFSRVEDSKPPLTMAGVENLLGRPASAEHSESTGITGDVYHYPSPSGGDMKVVFVNGTVFHAETVPAAKS